jgi:hypothetical protein
MVDIQKQKATDFFYSGRWMVCEKVVQSTCLRFKQRECDQDSSRNNQQIIWQQRPLK